MGVLNGGYAEDGFDTCAIDERCGALLINKYSSSEIVSIFKLNTSRTSRNLYDLSTYMLPVRLSWGPGRVTPFRRPDD